jgi:hypothetical protein
MEWQNKDLPSPKEMKTTPSAGKEWPGFLNSQGFLFFDFLTDQ